jgi:hypothetical protein
MQLLLSKRLGVRGYARLHNSFFADLGSRVACSWSYGHFRSRAVGSRHFLVIAGWRRGNSLGVLLGVGAPDERADHARNDKGDDWASHLFLLSL